MKVMWVFGMLLSAPLFGVLTNDSVLKMLEAGLSEDTIILAIQSDECEFTLDVDSLVALKQGGVSERVIQAMIQIMSPSSEPASSENASQDDLDEDIRDTPKPVANAINDSDLIPPFIQPQVGGDIHPLYVYL